MTITTGMNHLFFPFNKSWKCLYIWFLGIQYLQDNLVKFREIKSIIPWWEKGKLSADNLQTFVKNLKKIQFIFHKCQEYTIKIIGFGELISFSAYPPDSITGETNIQRSLQLVVICLFSLLISHKFEANSCDFQKCLYLMTIAGNSNVRLIRCHL